MTACPKTDRIVDHAYRKSAQHRHCAVRHPDTGDYCNGEGVVLAHIRLGNAGTGFKPPDDESLFLCSHHHDEFDGRRGKQRMKPSSEEWVIGVNAALWLVRNVFIPERKAYFRAWKMGVGR